jgi:hypothetical protein
MKRAFWIHFNRTNAKLGDADVWTIHQDGYNRHVKAVDVRVPVRTVFRGASASQPRAYLRGIGSVRIEKGVAVIS